MAKQKQKRYSMVIQPDLYAQVEAVANSHGASVVDILRRFMRLGIMLDEANSNPDAAIIVREAGVEKEIVLI